MHTLLAVGVTILTAGSPAQARPELIPSQPINVTFVMPVAFEETLSFLAKASGVTIELDDTVTPEIRKLPLSTYAISFRGATFEEALSQMTMLKGLSYTIVDAKTVRIYKKA
jgi:hypothetical protein